MKQQVLFVQGGGAGAHRADAKLFASLRRALGTRFEVIFPKMPVEQDPDYERWKPRPTKEVSAMPFWGGAGWRYAGFERTALLEDFGAKIPPRVPVFL